MNQLLTELANLVRESASTIDSSLPTTAPTSPSPSSSSTTQQLVPPQPSSPSPQQQQPLTSSLNPDGTENRRPPVKSNSITTLRNAIAEIQRLRTFAGLQPIHHQSNEPSSTASASVSSPSSNSSPRSTSSTPSRSSSPPSSDDLCSLSTLAALACQQGEGSSAHSGAGLGIGVGVVSHETLSFADISPLSTITMHPRSPPSGGTKRARKNGNNITNKRGASAMEEDENQTEDLTMMAIEPSPNQRLDSRSSQLYSPPLSPSSPTGGASQSSFASLSSFASFHHHQQHPGAVGVVTTPPTFPSLHSMMVSSSTTNNTGPDYQNQSNHF
ncbi:hypothetical protein BGX33_008804 [Mortierella sp. NVP41]|nr:hypothetical protein BGX33_008804 [Mortierella sp. NVP41]